MKTTMATSESESDDAFSAFESGLSEYASAESNAETTAGAEGPEDSGTTTSSNNDDDEFVDAFVDADGLKSAEEDDGGVAAGEVGEDASKSCAQSEVDLLDATSEAGIATTQEGESNIGINASIPTDTTDTFNAFGDINTAQEDIVVNESALQHDVASQEVNNIPSADFFGDVGSAAGTEPPATMTDSSVSAEVLDAPEHSVEKIDDDVNNIPESEHGSSNNNLEALESPSTLIIGDFSAFDGKETETQVGVPPSGSNQSPMEVGEIGGSVDVLSAFDDLDVQDAPLPSLDSFASSANEEHKPEAIEKDVEPDTDSIGDNTDAIDVTISSEHEVLNGIQTNDGDLKDSGQNIANDDGTELATTESYSASSDPKNDSNETEGGLLNCVNIEQTELDEAEADGCNSSNDNLEISPSQTGENSPVANSMPTLDNGVVSDDLVTTEDFGGFESPDETTCMSADVDPDATFGHLENGEIDQEASNKANPSSVIEISDNDVGPSDENDKVESTVIDTIAIDSNVSGDAAAISSGDDGFGGFGSFEEGRNDSTVPDDDVAEAPEAEIEQDDDFGGFVSLEEAPTNSAHDIGLGKFGNDLGGIGSLEEVSEQHDLGAAMLSSEEYVGGFVSCGGEAIPSAAESRNELAVQDKGFGGFASFEQSQDNLLAEEEEETPASGASDEANACEKADTNINDPSNDYGIADALESNLNSAASEMNSFDDNVAALSSDGNDLEGFAEFDEGTAVSEARQESTVEDKTVAVTSDAEIEQDDNVGGFTSFDEAPANQPPAVVSSADDDGFGNFEASSEAPDTTLPNAVTENNDDQKAPAPAEGEIQANVPSGEEESTVQPDAETKQDSENDDEQDAGFTSFEEASATQPLAIESFADDDGFGNFEAFSESPGVISPGAAIESDQHVSAPAEENIPANQTSAVASLADDEDDVFGDFGGFNAFEEAEDGAPIEIEQNTPATVEAITDQDDEFGDFGDFDTFEEASPGDGATTVNEHRVSIITAEGEAPASQPLAAVSSDDDGDEFGDFGDFEAFEEAPSEALPEVDEPTENDKNEPIPAESTPRPVLSVLNDSVRLMFQDVFVSDAPIPPDSEKVTCSELPFDIPMRKILPEQVHPNENCTSLSHQSEQELTKMKKYFVDLPCSPPMTILSDEKWYPYSQYEFHRDGSPYYTEPAERMKMTTPSVPEVLSIDLPTGFEASNLRSSPSNLSATPPPPSYLVGATPTVVDFPSTPKSKGGGTNKCNVQQASEESEELDNSLLSATGKRFMEQLPDLSFMLKPTLSLPNDKH